MNKQEYKEFKNTLASTFSGNVESNCKLAKIRKDREDRFFMKRMKKLLFVVAKMNSKNTMTILESIS